MKRMTYFVMALAVVLGLVQCKKEQPVPQNETEGVNITLNVENSGSRHDVNTGLGVVTFQDNDVIYVGDGSTYIGTLTNIAGTFSGTINNPTGDNPQLHFYFVGGLPCGGLTKGSTSSFTVDISNQSSRLPVLAYNSVDYTGPGSYSCELKNQCGLVKFPLANTAGSIKVGGMQTEATISFGGTPGIAPTQPVTTGDVRVYSESETEKWAILLPQEGVNATVTIGEDDEYTVSVPEITRNARVTNIPTIENAATSVTYLSELFEDHVAQDGDILSGILNGDYKVSIADGATVTLSGVTIAYSSNNFDTPGIECEGDATICLSGTNVVSCGARGGYAHYSGIYIHQNKTLTIEGPGSLTIALPSDITNYGAGIGGGYQQNCGNIVINGGTLDVTGAYAGIGASQSQSCGTITITGGTVTAQGGDGSAGIGTSSSQIYNGSICGLITISGGTVTAIGGSSAAGIGAGWRQSYNNPSPPGNRCAGVDITGGKVTATGGLLAAGIGSGYAGGSRTAYSICGPINITGGIVVATGGNSPDTRPGGAGIGTGYGNRTAVQSQCGAITITTSVTSVTATKGSDATNSIGLGGGYGSCGVITIGGIEYWDGSAYQNGGEDYLTPNQIVYQP